MDTNLLISLAIAILIGAATIVATLVAPKLNPAAKVFYEVVSASRIGHNATWGPVSTEVLIHGEKVESAAFLFSSYIENTGSKDITEREFLDPIRIEADGFEIISLEADAADGIGAKAGTVNGAGTLSWRILKPRERILLQGLITGPNENERSVDARKIKAQIRLTDVRIGKGRVGKFLRYMGVTLLLTIIVAVGTVIISTNSDQGDKLVKLDKHGAIEFALGLDSDSGRFRRCKPQSTRFSIASCQDISNATVASFAKDLAAKPAYIGQSALILFFPGFVFVYGTIISSLFVLSPRFKATFLRLSGARSLK